MNKLEAQAKLKKVKKEFNSLRVKDYSAPFTRDEGRDTFSQEYEFGDMYTKPERAVILMIEAIRLRWESAGLSRRESISRARATEILRHKEQNVSTEHAAQINRPLIKLPREPHIVQVTNG